MAHLQTPRARGRAGLERQAQDLGVGRRGVGAAEAFEAGLDELAAGAGPGAEHRTAIAVGGRLAGQPGVQIGPAGRDRIFGPQAEFGARAIARQVEAGPDVLAAEVEEGRRILQDRRLDPRIAGTARDGRAAAPARARARLPTPQRAPARLRNSHPCLRLDLRSACCSKAAAPRRPALPQDCSAAGAAARKARLGQPSS